MSLELIRRRDYSYLEAKKRKTWNRLIDRLLTKKNWEFSNLTFPLPYTYYPFIAHFAPKILSSCQCLHLWRLYFWPWENYPVFFYHISRKLIGLQCFQMFSFGFQHWKPTLCFSYDLFTYAASITEYLQQMVIIWMQQSFKKPYLMDAVLNYMNTCLIHAHKTMIKQ